MAPSFLALRDRLPSLYRPDDDDLAGERLPLAAADLVDVVLEPSGSVEPDALEARILSIGRGVSLQLPERTRLRRATLAPGLAPSPAYALAVVLPAGLRPDCVATVRDNVAHFSPQVEHPRFTLELRRLGVLSTYLLGIGELIDAADRDAALVMHAHWWAFADRARYSPFYLRRRALAGLPAPRAHDPDLVHFPYVRDLARLAASIPVVPWQEQTPRELAEAYRLRIRRVVELYRDGLGTLLALERMIEAELPVDLDAPPEQRDRGMVIDEFTPLRTYAVDARPPGNLDRAVAPLMHWPVQSSGLAPSPATLFVEGMAMILPEGTDAVAPPVTVSPAVELYAAPLPLAIGYRDTVAPGETLRLRPAFSSWLGGADGVERSRSRPHDATPGDPADPAATADPAAPGPWQPEADVPTGTVVALKQTADRVLWAAIDGGPGKLGTLARFDGVAWTVAVTGLARPHCLAEDSGALLVGTDDGVSRVPLFPAGKTFEATPVAGVQGPVLALWVGGWYWTIGTPDGILAGSSGNVYPGAIGGGAGTQIAVSAIVTDVMESFLFGTERGVFQNQPTTGHWYWYGGESASDQDPDWHRWDPWEAASALPFPEDGDVFLPPVRALLRARDGTLWIGTDKGIARYVARAADRMAFTTALEAYPDVGTGAVHAIAEDAHGVVWLGCEFGLVRADRRDLWHHDGSAWNQLGRLDRLYDGPEPRPRGSWRFDRTTQAWQRADARGAWVTYAGVPRTPQPAVHAIAWTDDVAGDLGQVDAEGAFASSTLVEPDRLVLHVKPTDDRIVAGGIPAVPRVPPGDSTWRYLELERDDEPQPPGRPSWTREGRRIIGAPPPAGVDPPEPLRFDLDPPASAFDAGVLAFEPAAAHVRMQWSPTQVLSVAARLRRRTPDEAIDPAVLDRVWAGMSRVRPAGVRTALAVDETIMRGDDVGAVAE